MHSTLNAKPTDDPHDIVAVAPDDVRVAPADDELSRLLREAGDRAAQGQHRAAQGEPATNVPRYREGFRAEQGFREQGFRAESAAPDITASAAAGRRAGAQADSAI